MVAPSQLLQAELAAVSQGKDLNNYLSVMDEAFSNDPPPFLFADYGDAFRECAMNPYWMIQSLISNSVKEGEGARDLWTLAGRIENPIVREKVVQHAKDEAKHARMYVGLIKVVFPGALQKQDECRVLERAPSFPAVCVPDSEFYSDEMIIDLLMQINLGEFRTRVHQLLMTPVLECICSTNLIKLEALLGVIAKDELNHLYYTAEIIDDWIGFGNLTKSMAILAKRLRQFNDLTIRELGTQALSPK